MEFQKPQLIKISAEELAGLKMLNSLVLVKLDRNPFELTKTVGGKELIIQTEQSRGKHLCTKGIVIKAPETVGWGTEDGRFWTATENEIQEGDEVFITSTSVIAAYNLGFSVGEYRIWDVEGVGECLYIHYSDIFMIKRGEELLPINGWVMMEMIDEKIKTSLYVPQSVKTGSDRIARVLKANKVPIHYHFPQDFFDCDEIDIKEGDIVLNDFDTNIPLESAQLDKTQGENVYMVQRNNILAVLEDFDNTEIEVK